MNESMHDFTEVYFGVNCFVSWFQPFFLAGELFSICIQILEELNIWEWQ